MEWASDFVINYYRSQDKLLCSLYYMFMYNIVPYMQIGREGQKINMWTDMVIPIYYNILFSGAIAIKFICLLYVQEYRSQKILEIQWGFWHILIHIALTLNPGTRNFSFGNSVERFWRSCADKNRTDGGQKGHNSQEKKL